MNETGKACTRPILSDRYSVVLIRDLVRVSYQLECLHQE